MSSSRVVHETSCFTSCRHLDQFFGLTAEMHQNFSDTWRNSRGLPGLSEFERVPETRLFPVRCYSLAYRLLFVLGLGGGLFCFDFWGVVAFLFFT